MKEKNFERKNKKLENREGERMCGLYIYILGGGVYLLPGASLFVSEFYSYKIQFLPLFFGISAGHRPKYLHQATITTI